MKTFCLLSGSFLFHQEKISSLKDNQAEKYRFISPFGVEVAVEKVVFFDFFPLCFFELNLWFNGLNFTTKRHKGCHKGLFQQLIEAFLPGTNFSVECNT
jgi:hypothetical protein